MTYLNISSLLTSKNCQWVLKLTSKNKNKMVQVLQASQFAVVMSRKEELQFLWTNCFWPVPWARVKAVLLVVNPLSLCNFLSSPVGLCSCNVKVACHIKYCTQNLYFSQIKFPFRWGFFNWSSLTYLRLILGKKDG